MDKIIKYNGAVFYVDMLGMGALTKDQIKLKENDYSPWIEQRKNFNPQFLAATLLAEFRKLLMDLKKKFKKAKISQLSDCAFIWSEDVKDVIMFATYFMHQSVSKGLLCRGGLSYGEIIETNENHKLGRFIVGKAVTDAVYLEGLSKGVRILINQDLPAQAHEAFGDNPVFFIPFTNPIDYQVYDEFKWYLMPPEVISKLNGRMLDKDTKIKCTICRILLANEIRNSPKFNWNMCSTQGKLQLKASISFLTENELLGIHHDFDWKETILGKRKEETYQHVKDLVITEISLLRKQI